MNRRRFLGLGAAGGVLLWGGGAGALGPRSQLRLAQLRYARRAPIPRPTALRRLAWEIDKRTSIDVSLEPTTLRLNDRRLFSYPLLYLGGDREFDPLPEPHVKRLARHLIFGGTLIIDSADPRPGAGFDKSVRRLVGRLFVSERLTRIKPEHTIYKSFYLLNRPVGRVSAVPYLEGVVRDGRLAVIYSQNDLGGAWARDNFGQWEFDVHPGGQRQRELAFRWGVNLVMYALCVDYKADQVHIPFILKRRRWQVGPGPR